MEPFYFSSFFSSLKQKAWIFQKGEKVYTISFEGDAETLKTFIPYIEDTWSLDGTGAVTD